MAQAKLEARDKVKQEISSLRGIEEKIPVSDNLYQSVLKSHPRLQTSEDEVHIFGTLVQLPMYILEPHSILC